MAWLLIAAAAIVVLTAAALAIPVQLDIRAEFTGRLRSRIRLLWLFGLVRVRVGGRDRRLDAQRRAHTGVAGDRRDSAEARSPSNVARRVTAVLRTSGVMERSLRFVRDVLGQAHIRDFVLRARYGLDDPAETGQVYGALAPLLVLASVNRLNVQCTPDFARSSFEGACSGTLSIRPLSVVAVVGAFLCSPPVWRAARAWRRAS
jgi:hypothetical protein